MQQAAEIKLGSMTHDQKCYLSSFYGWAKTYLRLPIYDRAEPRPIREVRAEDGTLLYTVHEGDWQQRAINAVDKHNSRVTVRTCNGAGKTTTLIPGVVLPHMALFPNSKVVITSGVDRQVRDQIFPALRAHEGKLREWKFNDMRIEAPNGAVCIGFSTDSGGKFEGWHGNKEELFDLFASKGPLLIIVDEAKSVAQDIYDAIERCTYQRLLYCSSCGPASGEFHASHHGKARNFTAVIKVPASECPHADHDKNVRLIAERGLDDPLVRSKVFADFMTLPGENVIDRAIVDVAMGNPPPARGADRKYMCDFAAGGDENVFGAREGNRIRIVDAWKERDTMRACGQFILHFRREGLSAADAHLIHGDDDGLGKPILDRLAELGWRLTRVHNGSEARNPERYLSLAGEAWWEAAKAIEQRRFILPNDELLAGQLSDRKPEIASDGRLGIESKKAMRKRGAGSPDRADVIVELMQPTRGLTVQHARELTPFEQLEEQDDAAPVLPGCFAGA